MFEAATRATGPKAFEHVGKTCLRRCPFVAECLADALSRGDTDRVARGGLTSGMRRELIGRFPSFSDRQWSWVARQAVIQASQDALTPLSEHPNDLGRLSMAPKPRGQEFSRIVDGAAEALQGIINARAAAREAQQSEKAA